MESKWKKRVVIFLVSQGITLLGSSIVQLAIIWYVTLQTSSGIWVTILTLCSFLPQMVISIFAGVMVDRYNRKGLIIISDGIIALATLLLALSLMNDTHTKMNLTYIIFVSFIRSLCSGLQTPAVNAVIPQLVPKENLLKFNGINGSIQSAIQFTAPAISGILLSFGSIYAVLFIDVITATIGTILLLVIKIPSLIRDKSQTQVSFYSEMKEGFSYVFHNRQVATLFAKYGIYIFLSVPSGFLAALFIGRMFGNSYLYLTINELIGFGGMFLGGIILSVWKGFEDRKKTFTLGVLGYGIFSMALGFTITYWQFGIIMFFLCLCIPIIQSSLMTILQENVEADMQGRVFSLLNAIFSGVMPLGMTLFGPLADIMPISLLLIVSGILIFLLGIINSKSKIR